VHGQAGGTQPTATMEESRLKQQQWHGDPAMGDSGRSQERAERDGQRAGPMARARVRI
jgi:hypothetical protein